MYPHSLIVDDLVKFLNELQSLPLIEHLKESLLKLLIEVRSQETCLELEILDQVDKSSVECAQNGMLFIRYEALHCRVGLG